MSCCVIFPFTARYIVHNSDWGSISTISVSLNGAPFGVVMSFSDGTVDNSTGVPYFYLAAADPVVHNIKSNPWASLSLSEAQSDYCKAHNWDPEEPLCSRTTLTGKVNNCCRLDLSLVQGMCQVGVKLRLDVAKQSLSLYLIFLL